MPAVAALPWLRELAPGDRADVWARLLSVPGEAQAVGWADDSDGLREFIAAAGRQLGVRLSAEDKARLIREAL